MSTAHKGTSPRMRGKRIHHFPLASSLGNIPAYAGKTGDRAACVILNAEHPRVCGENLSLRSDDFWMCGTSPRMRGKPEFNPNGFQPVGNIPAYAGKTSSGAASPGAR